MFTGIVEEIGRMKRVSRQGEAMVLTIEAEKVLEDIRIGDSIAINGVCLTVVEFDRKSFSADVMPETFRKTNLGQLNVGSAVNLERAMPANGRFGGHIVQGHVDTTGTIVDRKAEQNAVVFRIEPEDRSVHKYIVRRGSIAVDGISLTVVQAEETSFSVSIIPHTLSQTVLRGKQIGDTVNIECDLLGKYIEHLLRFRTGGAGDGESAAGRITERFLAEHGFL